MSLPTRALVTSLERGHEFTPITISITPEQVAAYLDAVGDRTAYGAAIPPLAVVALALQALQEQVALPEGALHTAQEVEHHGIIGYGDQLTMSGRVGARSERQGFVVTALDYEVSAGRTPFISARTTIMAAGGSR